MAIINVKVTNGGRSVFMINTLICPFNPFALGTALQFCFTQSHP